MHQPLIKMFSIDFNSDPLGQPAAPTLFNQARAEDHVKWCRDLGATAIQSFAVALNGFAWYRSNVAPVTPGMRGDFLREEIDLAHKHGLEVHGYFNLAGNAWYRSRNREQTSLIDCRKNIPLTTAYLDYFCRMAAEAAGEMELDGIFIDWFDEIEPVWIPAEKALYEHLMGRPFPAAPADGRPPRRIARIDSGDLCIPSYLDPSETLAFRRAAVERAWKRIAQAIRGARATCQIWLNIPFLEPEEPIWKNSPILKEVDMMLTERCDLRIADWLSRETGAKPVLVNLGGLGSYGVASWKDVVARGHHLYAYGKADPMTTLVDLDANPRLAQVRPAFSDAR